MHDDDVAGEAGMLLEEGAEQHARARHEGFRGDRDQTDVRRGRRHLTLNTESRSSPASTRAGPLVQRIRERTRRYDVGE